MGVKVKFFATFRDKAGCSVAEVEANTAGELLNKLAERYEDLEDSILEENGPEPELKSGVTVMVNGRNISFLSGNDTELEESDSVAIFPPIGGG